MNIDYVVADSEYGKGIFAKQCVKKGQMIWQFTEGKNVRMFDEQQASVHLESLPTLEDAQDFLDSTYGIHGKLGLILDDGQYMNHSLQPNCITDMKTGTTYALKDIEIDDELYEDYNRFEHPAFLFGLLVKYDCAPDYYELPPGPTRIEKTIEISDVLATGIALANDTHAAPDDEAIDNFVC